MSLTAPNLDDRTFDDLVVEARRRAALACPEWTDLSAGDPGIVLLDLFAYLTDVMLYRLNRLPDKAFIEFLRLIGVTLAPPAAASVALRFGGTTARVRPVTVPRGTRVTLSRTTPGGEPPVFVTAADVTLPAGTDAATVTAYHCEIVAAELAGQGTGLPGLSVTAARPPIVAPTGTGLDLRVGVELAPDEPRERTHTTEHDGRAYRLWSEVETFANIRDDPYVYMADRTTGTTRFAPAARMRNEHGDLHDTPQALAAVPGMGRAIRLWYWRGGGTAGNVAAGTLVTLKDPISGVEVTNPAAATGGRAAETLDNARIRGPQEFHSLQRAVTARDFQQVAARVGGVSRARAFTRRAVWAYAAPGTVEVLLVPEVVAAADATTDTAINPITVATLHAGETDEARAQVQHALDERRPLGMSCLVGWAHYKTVRVQARVVVRREENRTAIGERITARLSRTLCPVPSALSANGWAFGQALHASHVYDVAMSAEPGVRWVDGVRLVVENVPDTAVEALAADPFQPQTWYAGSRDTLFRSLNDGEGWEPCGVFAGAQMDVIAPHPERPGLLAVAVRVAPNSSRVYLSPDCGETWPQSAATNDLRVRDLAWLTRDGQPVLLLATEGGLYELETCPGATPVPVLVDPQDAARPLFAVAASANAQGGVSVAVAAQEGGGVFLSGREGRSGSFRAIGLASEDVRVLAVQRDGPRAFLWAGVYSEGGMQAPGKGAYRWELRGEDDPPDRWVAFAAGWSAGSCYGIAFRGTRVLASSHHGGVLSLEPGQANAPWEVAGFLCGLPQRDEPDLRYLKPVEAVAVNPAGDLAMAGGAAGVYRTRDGETYTGVSKAEFTERVTVPPTWLLCSGTHTITVVSEDEAARD